MMKKNKKGQSTLEYAILIIIIIAALLSLQAYIKRGVQGRLKSATDDIGDQYSGDGKYYKKTVSISNTYNNSIQGVVISGLRNETGARMTTNVITDVLMNSEEFIPKANPRP